MNTIGYAALNATDFSGRMRLDVALASTTINSSAKIRIKDRNIALRVINSNYNALAVYRDTTATAFADPWSMHSVRYEIRNSGSCYCPVVNNTGGSTTPAKAIVLETAHVAQNSNGDLIISPVTLSTIDEEGAVPWGDRLLRCVRSGNDWYLVVYY
jgi:hypothetical protein